MKRDAGWATAIAVAAATTFSLSSLQSGSPTEPPPIAPIVHPGAPKTPASSPFDKDACGDLVSHFQHFLVLTGPGELAPDSCYTPGHAPKTRPALTNTEGLRIVIATMPDPIHTHDSIVFDRDAEAIQQAASDSSYTFDSSWLPWQTDAPQYQLLADQDSSDDRKSNREAQPGIFLFRKALNDDPQKDFPYNHALIVFVVGEEATDGIHRRQFDNAIAWIDILSKDPKITIEDTQILGPTFSGSLPSLARALLASGAHKTLAKTSAQHLDIYSGHVTSHAGVYWFSRLVGPSTDPAKPVAPSPCLLADLHVRFHSFQEDDDIAAKRLAGYLNGANLWQSSIAVVSEDETAYGSSSKSDLDYGSRDQQLCPPYGTEPSYQIPGAMYLYYPRDISAVRAAYQEQSIFAGYTSQSSSTTTGRRTLRTDLSDSEGKATDTISSYGGNHTALSEEAVLLHIVDVLRAKDAQFVVLKGSNPLDALFLAHFFKLTYPEGRVIVLSDDLLFRREVGSGGLNGILTLSTYPLLPNISDWTAPNATSPDPHPSYLIFGQTAAHGTYVALRFLLRSPSAPGKSLCTEIQQPFLPSYCATPGFMLPDYAPPFWLSSESADTAPVSWLSVLGNDGFSPIASLQDDPPYPLPWSQSIKGVVRSPFHILGIIFTPASADPWPRVPLSFNICIFAMLLWAAFHAVCCARPSITVKPTRRAYFVRMDQQQHSILVTFGSILLVMVGTMLAWSCGWVSSSAALFPWDQPITNPWAYNLFPVVIWAIGLFSVLYNAWVERRWSTPALTRLSHRVLRHRPKTWAWAARPVAKAVIIPTLCFVLATFAFYVLLALSLDRHLSPQIGVPTFIRSMNLTSGVSPVVPVTLLALGMYGWVWFSLKGLALLGVDKPVLPQEKDLTVKVHDTVDPRNTREIDLLTMLSQNKAGEKLERLCSPFERQTWLWVGSILLVLTLAVMSISLGRVPIRALGQRNYSILVCFWLAISCSVLLANTWQLAHLWLRLSCMLSFLDKLPLRRTFQAMRGFSWGSIWKLGGNPFDLRYKLFYRQFESINRLDASLADYPINGSGERLESVNNWWKNIDKTRLHRIEFSEWYAKSWDRWNERKLTSFAAVQADFAKIAGMVLTEILIPFWRTEEEPLVIVTSRDNPGDDQAKTAEAAPPLKPYISNAEVTVCLVYLGFIQNILGRIRSLVFGMICLFLSIAFLVPSYPFDPRPLFTGCVIGLFIIVCVVVFIVYSQMFRDATLSHLTNTQPGELGLDFWLKFISFGVGPVLGLLATLFPEASTFLFSWIQPSLSSIK